jgi:hypothetical protein
MEGTNGLWLPTQFGLRFFYNEVGVIAPVATMNDVLLADNHKAWETHTKPRKHVYIEDLTEFQYKTRAEYQQEKSAQTNIF